MRVGLVIVTHNAEASVRRALDALAAQTRLPDEVVVHDNASTDGTLTVVRAAAAAWPTPVRVVESPDNIGFAAANNRAVERMAGCELVALLNPDAFPEPSWLAALVAAAAAHPEAASFASRQMLAEQPDRLDGAGDVCHVSGLIWRHGHGRKLSDVPDALRSRPVFSACAAAAVYRRADWEWAGGFDERFFCYGEDVDLGFRLQLAGRACCYVADAVVHHVGSPSSGAPRSFAVYHGHRNLEWLFVKDMPAALLWRYLPLHVLSCLAGLGHFVTRGQGREYVAAKRDALRGLSAAWRDRGRVQGTRTVPAAVLRDRLDRGSLLQRWLR